MQTTFALAALASVAFALPQAATLAPTTAAPAGCSSSYNGDFQVTLINITTVAKRELAERQAQCGQSGLLTVKLADGVLTDSQGRIGNIVANYQFQFDPAPGQAGALYTSGFSVCNNGSLALGGSNVFYSCLSGGFSNLYDRDWAPQCSPVLINVLPCGSSGSSTGTVAGQQSDGQPTGTAVSAPPVTQITDGQLQGTTSAGSAPPVTQISDGQIQATSIATGVPVTQISDGQIQASSAATGVPVTQISDGQIQATSAATGVPVTQISDGQIQATSAATVVPVTQISDGQIQATTAATGVPVTQISDGQIQATTAAGAPISQISDGQIQATATATGAGNATVTTVPFTGAGNGLTVMGSFITLAIGLTSVLLL